MDCLHFTLYGTQNYDDFVHDANHVATSFFTDGRYDLELEVEPGTDFRSAASVNPLRYLWKVEVTARRFELDE